MIEECEFVECQQGLYAWTPSSGNVCIYDSVFRGGQIGPVFLGGAGGEVRRCRLIDCKFSLEDSGEVTVTDCDVTREDGGLALHMTNRLPVVLTNNIFSSNGTVVYLASYGLGTIRDNQFLRTGDGYWIECAYHPSFTQDIDFSGNYWGTTDLEEISEGIWDCYDDPDTYNCVIFEPIADGPVRVESRSWSGVKALFDGESGD